MEEEQEKPIEEEIGNDNALGDAQADEEDLGVEDIVDP